MDLKEYFKDRLYGQLQESSIFNLLPGVGAVGAAISAGKDVVSGISNAFRGKENTSNTAQRAAAMASRDRLDQARRRDEASQSRVQRGYSDFAPIIPPRERIKDDFLKGKRAPNKKPKSSEFIPDDIPYDGRGRIPPRFDGNETPKTPLERIREREIIRKNPSYRNDGRDLRPRTLPARPSGPAVRTLPAFPSERAPRDLGPAVRPLPSFPSERPPPGTPTVRPLAIRGENYIRKL